MASTYAAIGVAAPSQAEFAAFADAMSTSYGAPIELVSIDPGSGQQTELADTSITNLLAELPVLETTASPSYSSRLRMFAARHTISYR